MSTVLNTIVLEKHFPGLHRVAHFRADSDQGQVEIAALGLGEDIRAYAYALTRGRGTEAGPTVKRKIIIGVSVVG